MSSGDSLYIKQLNQSSILQNLITEKMISRADLAKKTNLTRATISAQIADLIAQGLIVEQAIPHTSVGRKPIMLSLKADAGYALGIDLDEHRITYVLTDLAGSIIHQSQQEMHSHHYEDYVNALIQEIQMYEESFTQSTYNIVGITISIHGLIHQHSQEIAFVTRLNWRNVDLKSTLEQSINIPITIANNANLCALAERVFTHRSTNHLFCVTFYSGIGLGAVVQNAFYAGHHGFAGEAGHMIIMPNGHACPCGNKGCWGQYASDPTIMQQIAQLKNMSTVSYEQIRTWIEQGDTAVQQILNTYIYYVAIGLNNLINLFNPEIIVLDSGLLHIYPHALAEIQQHFTATTHYEKIILSSISSHAANLGGCALAIKQFLRVDMVNFHT